MESHIPDYVNALCREVRTVIRKSPEPVKIHTIFFGGGTPSLLSIKQFSGIFDVVRDISEVPDGIEISLEANPETVNEAYCQQLREVGFNRISLGMQSASPQDLKILDRRHDPERVTNVVAWSREAGFEHINLDLIFGIPRQTMVSWLETLHTAVDLGVDHLSTYSLIVEEGTPLYRWIEKGVVEAPDEDLAGEMYWKTMEALEAEGFTHYEISNFSRGESAACQHNLQYWRFLPYLGFGAGAHGFVSPVRTENTCLVPTYLAKLAHSSESGFPASPACEKATQLSKWDLIQENLMVSLRMTGEGVYLPTLDERYGLKVRDLFTRQIQKLEHASLVESLEDGKRLRLTRKGRAFGNRVFAEFIGNEIPTELADN